MSVLLRNNVEVTDRRLARIPFFDPRSLAYGIRELFTPDQEPRSKTWRCEPRLDQGNEGACVGFAWAHELAARPKAVEGMTDKFAEEEIYWAAQRIDKWDGGAYPGAEIDMDGTSVLAGVKVCKELGYIPEYRWAFSISDLVLAVGYHGPAVLGVPWYEGMFEPASCGNLHPTGEKVGGHAIACIGVSVKKQTFTLHNSWGKNWGTNGRAKITWADLEWLLKHGGEACIPVQRKQNV